LHKLYLFPTEPDDILVIDHELAVELQELLTISGDYQGNITGSYDESTRDAFRKFSGRENMEERWFEDAHIDCVVLEFMRQNCESDQYVPYSCGGAGQESHRPELLSHV